jgi:hypothetical protein
LLNALVSSRIRIVEALWLEGSFEERIWSARDREPNGSSAAMIDKNDRRSMFPLPRNNIDSFVFSHGVQ